MTTSTWALTANEELLRALTSMEQQNDRLLHELSKVLPKAVNALLEVHRCAGQQAVRPSFGVPKAEHLPLAALASPAATSGDSFGLAYATAHSNVGAGSEDGGIDADGESRTWVQELREDFVRQIPIGALNLKIYFS